MLTPNQYFQCLGLISTYFVYASHRIQGHFEIWKQVLTHLVPQDVATPCTSPPAERISDSPKYVDAASMPRERSSPQHVNDTFAGGEISESRAGPSQANETPVSTKQPLKRKTRLVFSPEDQNHAKKPKKEDQLQRSCNECLVSGK